MKGRLITAALALLAMTAAAPAGANNTRTPYLNGTERRLEWRIDNGIRNGAIDRQEARTLRRRLARLERREAMFKSDGFLSPRERNILSNEARNLSAMITRMTGDRGYNDRYRDDQGWDDGGWNGRGNNGNGRDGGNGHERDGRGWDRGGSDRGSDRGHN